MAAPTAVEDINAGSAATVYGCTPSWCLPFEPERTPGVQGQGLFTTLARSPCTPTLIHIHSHRRRSQVLQAPAAHISCMHVSGTEYRLQMSMFGSGAGIKSSAVACHGSEASLLSAVMTMALPHSTEHSGQFIALPASASPCRSTDQVQPCKHGPEAHTSS